MNDGFSSPSSTFRNNALQFTRHATTFFIRRLRSVVPRLNFTSVHWIYFIATCLVSALLVWASSKPLKGVSFVDSLLLTVSAMTEGGLNPVNVSTLNTFQQIVLWIDMLLGSAIFVSCFVVGIRRRAFTSRFPKIVEEEKRQQPDISEYCGNNLTAPPVAILPSNIASTPKNDGILSAMASIVAGHVYSGKFSSERKSGDIVLHNTMINESRALGQGVPSIMRAVTRKCPLKPKWRWSGDQVPYEGHVSGNAATHRGTEKGEYFHCVEYRAVKLLYFIVPAYFVAWQLIGSVGLGAYFAYNQAEVVRTNGANPWWLGAFLCVSAFNNVGMSLINLNMIPFRTCAYPLITMSLLTLAGNTAYPILLRIILRSMLCLLPKQARFAKHREALKFILRYPRRVYTNLFPPPQTWWLFGVLVLLTSIDWTAFEVLNNKNLAVTAIPMGPRILDGLFQAIAVRASGFSIVKMSSLKIGVQVLYVLMMYLAIYPVAISIRSTNVYEERSLGIHAEEKEIMDGPFTDHKTRLRFVGQQVSLLIGHDCWFLAISSLFIVWIETDNFDRDPVTYSVFNTIFEVVSGYGGVGLTTGIPNQGYSLSGGWHVCSKLILCAVMLRGRHRGLPVSIDRAVQLPSDAPVLGEGEGESHR